MSKELWNKAFEEQIEELMEKNPHLNENEAYDLVEEMGDAIHDKMVDRIADMADQYKMMRKDGIL